VAEAEAAEEMEAAGGDVACSRDGSRSSSERLEGVDLQVWGSAAVNHG